MSLTDGTTLGGRYVLDHRLDRRTDGLERWAAHDTTLERELAVWVLPLAHPHAAAAVDSARRAASVEDPRLVRVLDVGQSDGHVWVIEERLHETRSLAEILTSGPLPAEEARRLVGEAANALETARHRGLHHLRLDPDLLRRGANGDVKLVGTAILAGLAGEDDLSSGEATRTDTQGLAALLYAGLTGLWPLAGGSSLPAAPRLASGQVPSASEVITDVPADLDALTRMILRNQGGPQSPGELARELAPWEYQQVAGRGGRLTGLHPATADDARPGAAGPVAAAATVSAPAPVPQEEVWTRQALDGDETQLIPIGHSLSAGAAGAPLVDDAAAHDDDLDELGHDDPVITEATPAQTRIALALVAGFLALALVLAYLGVRHALGGADTTPPVAEPGTTTTQTTTADAGTGEGAASSASSASAPSPSASSTSSSDSAGSDPLTIARIDSYDPEGDKQEKPDLVAGINHGGTWRSHYYLTPNWGGLGMSGLGLRADLGSSQPVHTVTVTVPEGTYGYDIYVGDGELHTDGATKVASYTGKGSTTTQVKDGVEGRYVFVWFTTPWKAPSGYVAQVDALEVS